MDIPKKAIENAKYLVDRTIRVKRWKACANDAIIVENILDVGYAIILTMPYLLDTFKLNFDKKTAKIVIQNQVSRTMSNTITIGKDIVELRTYFDFLDCCFRIEFYLNGTKKLSYGDKELFKLGFSKLTMNLFDEVSDLFCSLTFMEKPK